MAYKDNEKATPITQRASALKYTGAVDLTSGKQFKKFQSFKIDAAKEEEQETQAPPPPLDEGECVNGKNTVTGEPCGSTDDEGKCIEGKNTKTGKKSKTQKKIFIFFCVFQTYTYLKTK